jgi:hypothetical protein
VAQQLQQRSSGKPAQPALRQQRHGQLPDLYRASHKRRAARTYGWEHDDSGTGRVKMSWYGFPPCVGRHVTVGTVTALAGLGDDSGRIDESSRGGRAFTGVQKL